MTNVIVVKLNVVLLLFPAQKRKSIAAGSTKSRFRRMHARALNTISFMTIAGAYHFARAAITSGAATLATTSSVLRIRRTQRCFARSSAATWLSRNDRAKLATPLALPW
jgi:hypothetical protein